MLTVVDTSPVQSFVTALVERDFVKLEQTLCEDIRFRALVPPGFREREGAASARQLIQSWFGDVDIFDVQYLTVEAIGDCIHAGYRVRVREGGAWYLCEQHLFGQTSGGRIESLNLICSGFRPAQCEIEVLPRREREDAAGLRDEPFARIERGVIFVRPE